MNKIQYAFLVLITLISCKEKNINVSQDEISNKIMLSKEQFETSKMEIGSPKEQEFNEILKVSGKIDVPAKDKAKITAVLGGYIKVSNVIIGQKVSKGQPIAIIENTEFIDIQKEYLEVSEQLTYLKSEYLRQKALFEENITSQKNYLKAESDYQQAVSSYNSLREKLQLININPNAISRAKLSSQVTIYSPINGVVVTTNANIGAYIAPENTIVEVVNDSNLMLSLSVFEKDILKLSENQEIQFTIGDNMETVYKSKIKTIGRAINEMDRSIPVFGDLDAELKKKLIVGMFTDAKIVIGNKKALALPTTSFSEEGDKKFLYLVTKKTATEYEFQKVAVKTGLENDRFTEVLTNSFIHQNSEVLTKGIFQIN
ncbi:efflux RND transporter periplasmic adaptor subunit [Flavobacterium sp. TP390]|uniref:Efflux RND transporter periplasmic adaptor subunit n=1 Tax=Flavobacterium profundi TaxID=1774945 RepID=A0A6I4IFD6_9FLAO|nr:efflux RND transporter periplasmic adaptor subunit [Flavobacterium profundi]MVO08308.1 efflux RND transporter periplasmic adaptor subunit [Flavobacterium profundi]